MTAEELLDRELIRALMAQYNQAGDRGRRDEFAAVFTDDAEMVLPWAHYSSKDEILAGLFGADRPRRSEGRPGPAFVRHNLTTSRIEFTSAGSAQGRTYFMVLTDIGLDHSGTYVDQFVRTEAGWQIRRREVRIDFASEDTRMLADRLELLAAQRKARTP